MTEKFSKRVFTNCNLCGKLMEIYTGERGNSGKNPTMPEKKYKNLDKLDESFSNK